MLLCYTGTDGRRLYGQVVVPRAFQPGRAAGDGDVQQEDAAGRVLLARGPNTPAGIPRLQHVDGWLGQAGDARRRAGGGAPGLASGTGAEGRSQAGEGMIISLVNWTYSRWADLNQVNGIYQVQAPC